MILKERQHVAINGRTDYICSFPDNDQLEQHLNSWNSVRMVTFLVAWACL